MLVGEGWRTALHGENGSLRPRPFKLGGGNSNYHSDARGPGGESIGPALPVKRLPKLRSALELFLELLSTSSQ